jgi:uncharacterized protein
VLVDEIRARMVRAMREKDVVVKTVLGLALGEIQTAEARANRSLGDEEAAAVVRKLIKSNEETLALASGAAGSEALRREIEALAGLLPAALSAGEIERGLGPVADAIRAARSEGQAMGVAMKHLKTTGAQVDAASVLRAIAALRAPP